MRVSFLVASLFLMALSPLLTLSSKDWIAYVDTTSSAVNAINLSTDTIAANIGGEIAAPTFIATNADGSRIYYTNQFSNTVGVIDRATNAIIDTITVGVQPAGITIFDNKAYVTNVTSGTISIIDLNTNQVINTLAVSPNPRAIAITPNGLKAYIVYITGTTVDSIDLVTSAVTPVTGSLPSAGNDVVISPDGATAYVTTPGAGKYSTINTATDSITNSYSTGGTGSRGISLTNDGSKAYIANSTTNDVSIIDLGTHTVITTISVGSAPFDVILSPDNSKAYAINTNGNSISVIDTTTESVTSTIINLITVPRSMAITPDGILGYVVEFSSNSVETLNLESNTSIAKLQNPFNVPSQLAINPTATIAYVPNSSSTSDLGLTLIDIASQEVIGFIPQPNQAALRPALVAITPDGTKAFVSNQAHSSSNDGQITVFDLINQTAITTIPVGGYPYGIAITADGTLAYVANISGTTLTIIDTATYVIKGVIDGFLAPNFIAMTPDGTKAYVSSAQGSSPDVVYVVDLLTDTISTTIAVGDLPEGIAITPDGSKAYVANSGEATVSVIETATNQVIQTITVGTQPLNIAISPDGKKAYVTVKDDISLSNNQVVVIDTETDSVIDSIQSSLGLTGIAITPDQAPFALFSIGESQAELPTIFNASASYSPVGHIATYLWDFGDGSTVLSTSPIISHTFALPGSHLVNLTVTNSAGTSTSQVFTGQTLSRNGGPTASQSQSISVNPFVLPPNNLKGKQIIKKRAKHGHIKVINKLKWHAPNEGHRPVEYRIYRDESLNKLIGTVSGNQFEFKDRHVKKGKRYTYFVVSVDAAGSSSGPASTTVKPKMKRASKKPSCTCP